MRNLFRVLVLALFALVTVRADAADETVKLGTVAPTGSVWDEALQKMGAEWSQATDGRVKLVVFAGGRQGDDPTLLRKIRLGQLQAAALSTGGLSEVSPAFHLFGAPFLFASQDELYAVVDALRPDIDRMFDQKGLKLLAWGYAGDAHIFSKQPIRSVDELKHVRLFTSSGNQGFAQWLSKNGFDAVPLSMPDVAQGLQTGIVDAVPSTPLGALSFQWYRSAPHMLEVQLAPAIGAVVISKKAWNALSDADRKTVADIATRTQRDLATKVPGRDRQAIDEMKKRGLSVTDVDDAREAQIRAKGTELARSMRGTLVPADFFDKALAARDAYRKQHGG